MAHNYPGITFPPNHIKTADGIEYKFTLSGAGREAYCKDLITQRIGENKADFFIILLDTFMTYPWLLDSNFLNAKSIFYFPSDGGGGMPRDCERILQKVNVPVAMAKFGQKQVKDYYNIDCEYIPHGVNTNSFKYMSPEEKEQFKAAKGLSGKFVIGVVARNQGRKMLDRAIKTLAVFSIFAKDHPDAVLLFHSDPYDLAAVFDMNRLIARYGLQNRVLFTGVRFFNPFNYSQLNEVYALMDVFLLPTSGEGFGIPIIEAMACGVPQVVTDYTTTPQLLMENGQCGEPVKLIGGKERFHELYEKGENLKEVDNRISSGCIMGNWDVERGIMDDYDCAEKLHKLYADKELRRKYGKVGREKAEKYYSWDVVLPQWEKLLEKMSKQ